MIYPVDLFHRCNKNKSIEEFASVGGDVIVVIVRGEVECFVKEVMADVGVEVFNVEANEAGALIYEAY